MKVELIKNLKFSSFFIVIFSGFVIIFLVLILSVASQYQRNAQLSCSTNLTTNIKNVNKEKPIKVDENSYPTNQIETITRSLPSFGGSFVAVLSQNHVIGEYSEGQCSLSILDNIGNQYPINKSGQNSQLVLENLICEYGFGSLKSKNYLSWVSDTQLAIETSVGQLLLVDVVNGEERLIRYDSAQYQLLSLSTNAEFGLFLETRNSMEPGLYTAVIMNMNNPLEQTSLTKIPESPWYYFDRFNNGFLIYWRSYSEPIDDQGSQNMRTTFTFTQLPELITTNVKTVEAPFNGGRGCYPSVYYASENQILIYADCFVFPNNSTAITLSLP